MNLTFKKNELINDIFINHYAEHINIKIVKPNFEVISFIEKIGGSHQINKDWKISGCNTVVLKPKQKEITFNRELLTYYVLSTNKEFQELYKFMASFLGLYTFDRELYIGVSNIVKNTFESTKRENSRTIDIKMGHFCFDKLMYGPKPEKEVYYEKGWRVIGTKKGNNVFKYMGATKKGPKDGLKEEELLRNFLFAGIDEEKKKAIQFELYQEIKRIKDYFERENRIDVISGSILISVNDGDDAVVNVKIIDLAHTYFYSSVDQNENKRIFFKGVSAFIEDLAAL